MSVNFEQKANQTSSLPMLVLSHATSLCFLNNLVSHDDDVDDGHDDDDGNDDGDDHNVTSTTW